MTIEEAEEFIRPAIDASTPRFVVDSQTSKYDAKGTFEKIEESSRLLGLSIRDRLNVLDTYIVYVRDSSLIPIETRIMLAPMLDHAQSILLERRRSEKHDPAPLSVSAHSHSDGTNAISTPVKTDKLDHDETNRLRTLAMLVILKKAGASSESNVKKSKFLAFIFNSGAENIRKKLSDLIDFGTPEKENTELLKVCEMLKLVRIETTPEQLIKEFGVIRKK